MILPSELKIVFKVICALVAVIFLWQQVAWAADLIDYTLQKINVEQSQTFAPQYLQNQQAAQQNLIGVKQGAENFVPLQTAGVAVDGSQAAEDDGLSLKGPMGGGEMQVIQGETQPAGSQAADGSDPSQDNSSILSVTTESGDIIHYKEGAISYIERPNGDVIRGIGEGSNIVVDGDDLIEAEITYADGTVQIVRLGKVETVTRPDGTIYYYNTDELIESAAYPDNRRALYSYTKDGNNISQTVVTAMTAASAVETVSYYGSDNRLSRVEFFEGGLVVKTVEYDRGVISKIINSDLSQYVFDITENPGEPIISNLSQYITQGGSTYTYIYDDADELASIYMVDTGMLATYNKEGVLVKVVNGDETITDQTVAELQAAYDAAFAAYQEIQRVTQNCQTVLNNAAADLTNKDAAKNAAWTSLDAAIQNLAAAQSAKEAKQAACNTAYNAYLNAQSAYNTANTALSNARTAESQAQQNLTNAQNNLAAKQSTLNTKISARQAAQTTVTNLTAAVQADQTSLAQAQQNLTQAKSEESAAQSAYNSALADFNTKQAVYNNAVKDRQAKEAALNTANANLTTAQQAKVSAESALSAGGPYAVSSYAYSSASTVLNQCRNFINDQFDSYNSAIWYKPADTLVTIGGGTATLKGTGKNYNATFYSKQSYNRTDRPVLSTTFKVSSTSGRFIAALDGYTASNSYRRVGIFIQSGRIYAQTVSGSTTTNSTVLISSAKANTNYNVEFAVTGQDIKIYLWGSAAAKPVNPSYTYTVADWNAARPYFSLYSGTATVDCVTMKSPAFSSTYNSASQLLKDVYQDQSLAVYSYSAGSITISDYRQYLAEAYDLSTAGLWYKPADTLVTIGGGIATLKGTGTNYNAAFYSNQYFQRGNNPVFRSNFKVSSTSGNFTAVLEGATSAGAVRKVGITVKSGKVYVQTVSGSTTSNPATLVATAKANVDYALEFQATGQNIKIYLWEASASKPVNPSYTYTVTDWASARPSFSVYSGTATVSNVAINYAPLSTRTVASSAAEYSGIMSRNQLVRNLSNAISNLNAAQSAYNSANSALSAARAVETQAQTNLTNAQTNLNAKQTALNTRITARQGAQAAVNNLTSKVQADQAALVQAQTNLTSALGAESAAQTDYNNALNDVNNKQAAYNSAVAGRQAKEIAFSAASANLTAKTTAKNQAYTDLQTAIQNLANAQTQKNQKQSAYDTACGSYTTSKFAYDSALSAFTAAKTEEETALAAANSILGELNEAKAILAMFPISGSVLSVCGTNEGPGILSVSYDSDRNITKVVKMDGSVVEYKETGPDLQVLLGGEPLCDFKADEFGNINKIIAQRTNVSRAYDLITGELLSLEKDDAEILFSKNGASESLNFSLSDGAFLTAPVFDATDVDKITDGIIRKKDDGGNILYEAEYKGGLIIFYKDSYGNKYTYDSGSLSKLEKFVSAENYITYNYASENIRVLSVPEGEREPLAAGEAVILKYDSDGRLIYLETKDGHYKEFDYGEDRISVAEGQVRDVDGVKVHVKERTNIYNRSTLKLEYIEEKDGSKIILKYDGQGAFLRVVVERNGITYDNLVLDSAAGIISFDAVHADGFTERISVCGGFKDVAAKDGLGLLYYEEEAVAVVTPQGPVYLKDKEDIASIASALPQAFLEKYFIDEYINKKNIAVDITKESWVLQGYSTTLAFESLTKDCGNNQLIVGANLRAGDSRQGEGEIFMDIRGSNLPYLNIPAGDVTPDTPDLTGQEISFLVKLPEGSYTQSGRPLYIQAFAKDQTWRSQYGATVSVTEDGKWYRVSLRPCAGTVEGGLTSADFDPTKVALIGVKVWAASDSGIEYNGDVLVKSGADSGSSHEALAYSDSPLPANVNTLKRYFKDIDTSAMSMGSERNYVDINDMKSLFKSGLEVSNHDANLDGALWHTQNYSGTRAVESITKDDANGQWLAGSHFITTGGSGRSQGEMVVDLRYDVPGLKWQGPVDLRGKTLKFKVKAPPDLIKDPAKPNYYAQIFIKDSQYRNLTGPCVNISEADKGYDLCFNPTSYAGCNFIDVTSVIEVGIRFGAYSDAVTEAEGAFYVKDESPAGIFENTNFDKSFVNIGACKRYMDKEEIAPDIDKSVLEKALFMSGKGKDYLTGYKSSISDGDLCLDSNPCPGAGPGFIESGQEVWKGRVAEGDLSKLGADDAVALTYETYTDAAIEKKRIAGFVKKSGDATRYQYDAAGRDTVEEFPDKENGAFLYRVAAYDEKGGIKGVKVVHDDPAKGVIVQEYKDGRIQSVTQDGKETLTYDYKTLAGGREATVITDASYGEDDKLDKYYVDGQLVKTADNKDNKDNKGVETDYVYDKDGRISKSSVSRRGKTIEIYEYSYDDKNGYTVIKDMAGVKKAYDSKNKLVYVERGDKTYTYYYSNNPFPDSGVNVGSIKDCMNGLTNFSDLNNLLRETDLSTDFDEIEDVYQYTPAGDFALEELSSHKDAEGNIIQFKEGAIASIKMVDGSEIKDIVCGNGRVSGYTIVMPGADGKTFYTVKDGCVRCEEAPDGTRTYYHPNGWVSAMADRDGKTEEYIYEIAYVLSGNKNGSNYYAAIDETNGKADLTIADGAPIAGANYPADLTGKNFGTFTSDVIETNAVNFGSIFWSETLTAGSRVVVETRTGGAADIKDKSWGPWSACSQGSTVSSAAAKYLQYRITLFKDAAGESPEIDLDSIRINMTSRLADTNDSGLMQEISADGKTYVYDSRSRLAKIIQGGTAYYYTPEGKIERIEEPAGRTTAYIYDNKDRTKLTGIVVKDGKKELRYDAERRLTKVIDPSLGKEYEYFYNGDTVSVKTTATFKQNSRSDFVSFLKDDIAVSDYDGVTRIRLAYNIDGVAVDYGTGLDGKLEVGPAQASNEWIAYDDENKVATLLQSRVYDFESIHVESGWTLTVQPWDGTTGGEMLIKSQGPVVIDGAIDVSAKGYRGGVCTEGRPGNKTYTSTPGESFNGRGSAGSNSNNYGGGGAGRDGQDHQDNAPNGAGGGGGGYSAAGCEGQVDQYGKDSPGGLGGAPYGEDALTNLYMGSGGGAGGSNGLSDGGGGFGGAGGVGGGVIKISASYITVSGTLSANGANGANGSGQHSGGGGGGSGGAIWLTADNLVLAGTVTSAGGYRGERSMNGGDGGNGSPGRIRIDYAVREGAIFGEDSSDQVSDIYKASIYPNQLKFADEGTLTSGAIELGAPAQGASAYLNANLDIPMQSNVKVWTRTGSSSDTTDTTVWSSIWQEATLDQYGYKINSVLDKFIQYKFELTTEDKDSSPAIYALDDFAVKLTITDTSHKAKGSVETYGNPDTFNAPAMPEVRDLPQNRIISVSDSSGTGLTDWTAVVNPSLTYNTADKLSGFSNTIYSNILKDEEPVVTKFAIDDKGGMKTEYVQKKDGSIEHYEADGKVRFVTDSEGGLLVRYYYDDTGDGSLKDVRFWKERKVLSHEILTAENEILEKRLEDLARLADEAGSAHANLDKQVKDIQVEIDSTRAQIEAMRYITYETQARSFFGSKKVKVVVENPYYAAMIAKLDLAEEKFHDNAALAYFGLANMENVSKGRIESACAAALSNLKRQRDACMEQIIRKELTALIYDSYMKFLGRLPSIEELNDLIERLAEKSAIMQDTYTINLEQLKTELQLKEDCKARVEQIDLIIARLTGIFNSDSGGYFAQNADNSVLIEDLGLKDEETAAITSNDWTAIYNWLIKSRDETVHFGQSAFLVLKDLVDEYYNKNSTLTNASEDSLARYVRIATNTILVDILTGVINPFTTGDLKLSLFALSKAAGVEHLMLDAYKLDWEDLVDRVAEYKVLNKERVMIHTNSNHYVLVTNIDAEGNITYFEPNMGQNGEHITVTKDEFLKIWKGYALSARAPPEAGKKLSVLEAQKVKGSCIFLIISIVLSVVSFALSFIDNEFCQILSKILALVAVVTGVFAIFESIGNVFASFVSSLEKFGETFTAALSAFTGTFAKTLPQFVSQVVLPFATETIVNTLISIPVSITMTRGLEFLGLDTGLARIAGGFLTGGIATGLIESGLSFSVGGAMQGFVFQGIQELGEIFDINPMITDIAGIALSSVFKVGFDAFKSGFNGLRGLEAAFAAIGSNFQTTIKSKLVSELAYIAVTELGNLIGVPDSISYLAGVGIRSSINAGYGRTGVFDWKEAWSGIQAGLLQGATSVALQWAGQEIGMDPLISSLTFSAIGGAIEGLFGVPQYDPITKTYKVPNGILEGIFNAYNNNVLCALGAGLSNDPWQQSVYISQILDFSKIIKEQGLAAALNTYAAGIFNQVAVGSMVNIAGSVGNYFAQKISSHQYTESNDGGYITRNYNVEDFGYVKTAVDEFGNEYMKEVSLSGSIRKGDFGIDSYNRFGITSGELATRFGDEYVILQRIENGQQAYTEVKDWATNETLLVISPRENGGYNVYDDYGKYVNAVINSYQDGYKVDLRNPFEYDLYMPLKDVLSEDEKVSLQSKDIDLEELMLQIKREKDGSASYKIIADSISGETPVDQSLFTSILNKDKVNRAALNYVGRNFAVIDYKDILTGEMKKGRIYRRNDNVYYIADTNSFIPRILECEYNGLNLKGNLIIDKKTVFQVVPILADGKMSYATDTGALLEIDVTGKIPNSIRINDVTKFSFDGIATLSPDGKIENGILKLGNLGDKLLVENNQIKGRYDRDGNFTPIGQISQEDFIGYLSNLNSMPLMYVKGNGINNLNFENYSPLGTIASAEDFAYLIKQYGPEIGYDLSSFKQYAIPSFERVFPPPPVAGFADAAEVLLDAGGLWYLTGEFQNKLNDRIGNRGTKPYILDLESGDAGPGLRTLNETGDRATIVFINSGFDLGQQITNPNVQFAFNFYTNNELDIAGIKPGKHSFGVPTYNIRLDYGEVPIQEIFGESYHVNYNKNKDNTFYWFVQNLKALSARAPIDGGAAVKDFIKTAYAGDDEIMQSIFEDKWKNKNEISINKDMVKRVENIMVKR